VRAVELYRGPFLDGFFLSDAPEFERWVEGEREKFRRNHAAALEGLAEVAAAERDFARAAEWWRLRFEADPSNTRVTMRLMEALEAAGDRAGALRQARFHATLLEQEFGARIDCEVEVLAQRLRLEPVLSATSLHQQRADPLDGGSMPAEIDPFMVTLASKPSPPSERPDPAPNRLPARRTSWRTLVPPMAVMLAVAAALTGGWLFQDRSAPSPAELQRVPEGRRTIAVLPFVNLSGDPEGDHFGHGLAEELISRLSRVASLRVIGRTYAFTFRGEERDAREIGKALGAGTVLVGRVRKEGDRVRVTAQLIDVEDGFHLWARTYERGATDPFSLQHDLTLRIIAGLQADLTRAERAQLARRSTASPEAYEHYLRGRYFWNQRSQSGYSRAIEYFERALEEDPQYAQAYAGLASVYAMQGEQGYLAPEEARQRTRSAVLQAIQFDGELAEAHTVLGGYLYAYAWNWEAAERQFLRAIELDPNYPTAHHWYGNLLTAMGRFDDAIGAKKKALELDPLVPVLMESLASTLARAGRHGEAFEAYQSAIELDSTYWRAHSGLGSLYEATGRMDEAVRARRRAAEFSSGNVNAKAALARLLAVRGHTGEARGIVRDLQSEAVRTGIFSPSIASALLALDNVEGSLTWLERGYEQRHPNMRHIGGATYARLEQDPRYLRLRRRLLGQG
jgi:TolB-like protein/Tfp pilus assembly protein PilF